MKPKLEWSTYQKDIFRDVAYGSGHTIIVARAGSSKTTSLVESIKYIPKKLKTLFVAFNKKIAEELNERINKSYCDTMTLHSLGFRAIRNAFGSDVVLNNDKAFYIAKELLEPFKASKQEQDDYETIQSLCNIVGLCKGHLIDTPTKIDELMDKFGIDVGDIDREDFIKLVCQCLKQCKNNKKVIDFNDMVWFCAVYNLSPGSYDRVFIDEAQDLNAAQIQLALSACKKDGRICAVGDNFQAIYAFAGADSESINNIQKRLNAKTLPLPISYRCATSIIKLAQELVPDIQPAPFAKEGSVSYIKEKELLTSVAPGDFILSRVNAPLIKYCLKLLKMKVPANIQGRDVGANLSYLIKKSKKKTVESFLIWLTKWGKEEIKRLQEKNRDATIVIDKIECLENLCEEAKTLDDVKDNIKELFVDGDDSKRVILSSVHKSKGLERARVFVLGWTLRESNQEECNIKYVAFTRAKESLFIVEK